MMIEINGELEVAVAQAAAQAGVTAEELAMTTLARSFKVVNVPFIPTDDWERRLLSVATDCGVIHMNEQLSSEEIYD